MLPLFLPSKTPLSLPYSKAYLDKLEKYMEDQFQQYCKINESKNIFKSARTPITLFIVLAVAYVAHVSPFTGVLFQMWSQFFM